MMLHILFEFVDGPYGGGNQFLKALKAEFVRRGIYTEDPMRASVIIYNSHHLPERVLQLKTSNKRAVFIHRLDGPMRLFTSPADSRDQIAFSIHRFADAVIFQSEYSFNGNVKQGLDVSVPCFIIGNAPDPAVFFPGGVKSAPEKLSIVATSWSGNIKKGFDVYEWLDNNLDFSRYDMTFIGNSPVEFKNIALLPPLPSVQLAEELRKRHVYITASVNDPCSNSLIEAIHCGLVPVARNSGGHPEIVRNRSLLFSAPEKIPKILTHVWDNYGRVRLLPTMKTIDIIAGEYIDFARFVRQTGKRDFFRRTAKAVSSKLQFMVKATFRR